MEGQDDGYQKNPLELMLMNYGSGNVINEAVNYKPESNSTNCNHLVTSDHASTSANDNTQLPSLPHCFESHRTPLNYYEFLTENSPLFDKAPPPTNDDAPVLDSELFNYNNFPGLASSSIDLDSWKLMLNPYTFNTDTLQSPSLNEFPINEVASSEQVQSHPQSNIPWTQELASQQGCSSSSSRSRRAKVAPSVFLSDPGSKASRQKAILRDRQRKEHIAERLKALQEILPHSVEGSQSTVMDEIIDYVQYLQFQMKELSRRKLWGDLWSGSPIYPEGHQHYILHKQTTNATLEDTMAKFLAEDPSGATQFLESKGLFIMPMALADRLKQVI